jgi:hypothetical protein
VRISGNSPESRDLWLSREIDLTGVHGLIKLHELDQAMLRHVAPLVLADARSALGHNVSIVGSILIIETS